MMPRRSRPRSASPPALEGPCPSSDIESAQGRNRTADTGIFKPAPRVAAAQENKRWARGGGGGCSGFAADCRAAGETPEDWADGVNWVDWALIAARSRFGAAGLRYRDIVLTARSSQRRPHSRAVAAGVIPDLDFLQPRSWLSRESVRHTGWRAADLMAPARTGTWLACQPYPTKAAVENAAAGRENYRSIEPVP
jgi:hypothetical protein